MSEQELLPEYKQGDTVRLTVELRDKHGVREVSTTAFLEGSGDHSDPLRMAPKHTLSMVGWLEEATTHAEIVMHGTVEQQPPGVYVCYAIVGENSYSALSRHELDPPKRFRIVEHPDDIREGPEVLSVGELW